MGTEIVSFPLFACRACPACHSCRDIIHNIVIEYPESWIGKWDVSFIVIAEQPKLWEEESMSVDNLKYVLLISQVDRFLPSQLPVISRTPLLSTGVEEGRREMQEVFLHLIVSSFLLALCRRAGCCSLSGIKPVGTGFPLFTRAFVCTPCWLLVPPTSQGWECMRRAGE